MICIWSSWCCYYPIISCFIKIQTGLTFLVPAYPGCPGKEASKWASVSTQSNSKAIHCIICECCRITVNTLWSSLLTRSSNNLCLLCPITQCQNTNDESECQQDGHWTQQKTSKLTISKLFHLQPIFLLLQIFFCVSRGVCHFQEHLHHQQHTHTISTTTSLPQTTTNSKYNNYTLKQHFSVTVSLGFY